MRVADSFSLEPLIEIREVLSQFFTIENSINHVTAKKSNFDLVSEMRIYLFILMDALEYVRSRGSVRKFELVKLFLSDAFRISLLEIFDRHMLNDRLKQIISILIVHIGFHVLLIELTQKPFIKFSFGAF